MEALIIQHDHVSPPGPVADRLVERGYSIELHEVVGAGDFDNPGVPPQFPTFSQYDIVVTMGAPWSAYDHDLIGSWVLPELILFLEADRANVPVLGICFGGQLLASAHGGSVNPSPYPEVGWAEITSTDENLIPSGRWFQWHYDRWSLPPHCRQIAYNAHASQAFVVRRNLGVQFHPELTSTMLTGWLACGGAAKAQEFGLDPQELLATAHSWDDQGRARAAFLVDAFFDRVATGEFV